MKPLVIAKTSKTPEASLDNIQGVLEIIGRSIPENAFEYYSLLMNWIEQYKTNPKEYTTLNINLEYFNSASSICIMDVIKSLETLVDSGNKITVNWFYDAEDEDMKDEIEIFGSMLRIPLNKYETIY